MLSPPLDRGRENHLKLVRFSLLQGRQLHPTRLAPRGFLAHGAITWRRTLDSFRYFHRQKVLYRAVIAMHALGGLASSPLRSLPWIDGCSTATQTVFAWSARALGSSSVLVANCNDPMSSSHSAGAEVAQLGTWKTLIELLIWIIIYLFKFTYFDLNNYYISKNWMDFIFFNGSSSNFIL